MGRYAYLVYIVTYLDISQSVSHYHTPSRELMDHTHSTVLLFEYGDYLCNVCISLFCFLSSARARTLEDDVHGVVLSSLRFSPCFSSLILMRTDLVVEPSTR